MSRRHQDALSIINPGACNPSGIAHSILDACREMRDAPGYCGTAQLATDPAIKLMVFQLAFLTGVISGAGEMASGYSFDECKAICENAQRAA